MFRLILIVCASCLIPCGCERKAVSHGPKLSVPGCAQNLYLGEGLPGDVKKGELPITNAGDEDLRFSVVSSCACNDVHPREGVIKPGETACIVVSLKLKAVGAEEQVALSVQTNDPEAGVFQTIALARSPSPFIVAPSPISFGNVILGKTESRTIVVLSADKQAPVGEADVEIETSPANLKATWNTSQVVSGALSLSHDTRDCFGHWNGRLAIRKKGQVHWLEVPVSGFVVEAVSCAPRVLMLERHPNGGQSGRVLVWRQDGAGLGDIVPSPLPNGVVIEVVANNIARKCLRVEIAPGCDPPEQIALSFTGHSEAVTIRMQAEGS